jgi:hypothetical protein
MWSSSAALTSVGAGVDGMERGRNGRRESRHGHAARAGGAGAGRAGRRERGRQRAERVGDAGRSGAGETQSEQALPL